MIFRDKKTGALLNIRRDEFDNDRLYFREIIRSVGEGIAHGTTSQPRFSRPFDEVTNEG